jgi:hypothetical protein
MKHRMTHSLITLALLWAGVCLLLSLGVRLPIFFAGRIAGTFDPTIGEVLSAWQEATVSIPLWLLLPCGLIAAAWIWFLLRRNREKHPLVRGLILVGGLLSTLILLLGFSLLLLWSSKINGIPVSVIAEILGNLAGSL